MSVVDLGAIRAAAIAIAGQVRHTPCLHAATTPRLLGCELHLKFENLQFTASSKARVAYHGARPGLRSTIFMPQGTPLTTLSRTRVLGADLRVEGSVLSQAPEAARAIARETGADVIEIGHDRPFTRESVRPASVEPPLGTRDRERATVLIDRLRREGYAPALVGPPGDRAPSPVRHPPPARIPMTRKTLASLLLGAVALIVAPAAPAQAPAFPTRSVSIVVPYAPGGGHDAMARLLAERLASRWGQPVIVENKAGANGMIGAEAVTRAAPDGHTLMMASPAEIVIAPSAYRSMRYDPTRDLAPVTLAGNTPLVLVAHPSVPARTLPEVVELAKREPRKHSYGTAGNASSQHLAGEWLNQLAGIDLQHVPYKGAGPATTDVLGGQIPFALVGMAPVAQHIRAGRLNAIAVTTAARVPFAPDTPTFAEVAALKDFEVSHWMGVLAPAGTPAALVRRVRDDIAAVLAEPAMIERLRTMGIEPVGNTPEAFAAQLARDREKFARIFRQAGLSPE